MSGLESFENFIIKCCELDEWDLRDFLREKLTDAGFAVQEDNYKSYRQGNYQKVHNMLAIRGEEPRICLVAHTDVCRDHGSRREHKKAVPVIKEVTRFGKKVQIIQDAESKVQVGGDDRLGVAINTWIALHTGYDIGLLFTTDEEVGAISADYVSFPELGEFDLLVQVDRGNHSNQLVTNISGVRLCNRDTAERLIEISKRIELPRYTVQGLLTDVLAIKGDGKCKEAVNMTCGYHASIGSSPNEYIDIQEAKDTMKYVSSIIQDYEMETIGITEEDAKLEEEFKRSDSLTSEVLRMAEEPMTQEEIDNTTWN